MTPCMKNNLESLLSTLYPFTFTGKLLGRYEAGQWEETYLIDGLEEDTSYNVTITPRSNAGQGPMYELRIKTRAGVGKGRKSLTLFY